MSNHHGLDSMDALAMSLSSVAVLCATLYITRGAQRTSTQTSMCNVQAKGKFFPVCPVHSLTRTTLQVSCTHTGASMAPVVLYDTIVRHCTRALRGLRESAYLPPMYRSLATVRCVLAPIGLESVSMHVTSMCRRYKLLLLVNLNNAGTAHTLSTPGSLLHLRYSQRASYVLPDGLDVIRRDILGLCCADLRHCSPW